MAHFSSFWAGCKAAGKKPQFKELQGPKAKIRQEEGEVPGLPAGREQSSPGMGWEALGGLWRIPGHPSESSPSSHIGSCCVNKEGGRRGDEEGGGEDEEVELQGRAMLFFPCPVALPCCLTRPWHLPWPRCAPGLLPGAVPGHSNHPAVPGGASKGPSLKTLSAISTAP